MAEHLSTFVPEGIDPFDEQAACQAACDCVNAVGQLLETANHQRRGTLVTESAILRCFYDMDCAVANAGNFHACSPTFASGRTAPCAEAANLAQKVRSRWMKAVVEWKDRTKAPSDGWFSLWQLYAQHFGNQVGPTWADAAASVEKSDADEKGLINTAKIYIPQEALEHQWHFGAWPFVCEQLKRFDATDLNALVQSLTQLRDSFDVACAKPSSETVEFLEAVRDEVRYAADAKRQQLTRGYSNGTLASMISGIEWAEAGKRVAALSDLQNDAVGEVARVLGRELTVGTVEQIDELLMPAVRNLRNAWENRDSTKSAAPAVNSVAVEAALWDERAFRALVNQTKADIGVTAELRQYMVASGQYDFACRNRTLNKSAEKWVTEILDHERRYAHRFARLPAGQHSESAHPFSEERLQRFTKALQGGDASVSAAVGQAVSRLRRGFFEGRAEFALAAGENTEMKTGQTNRESAADSPTKFRGGWMGDVELAASLGVHSSQISAFRAKLKRMRDKGELSIDDWQEFENRKRNEPQFLYSANAPAIVVMAKRYSLPK